MIWVPVILIVVLGFALGWVFWLDIERWLK